MGDDDNTAATNYNYFMTKEPREELGPIRVVDDPYLGRTKVRDLRVGMTRNAKEENKKVVTAYLQPYPHTRIDNAKPLQGWYQAKVNESAASRPRPCFTEAVLTEPYGGWCAVGCAFSLPAGEVVDTPVGPRPIESFNVGDVVYGRTIRGVEPVRVLGTSRHTKPEGIIEVTVSDGRRLRMTGDHPVYRVGSGWVNAETLEDGDELESSPLYGLRESDPEQEVLSAVLVGEQPPEATPAEALSGLRGSAPETRAGDLRRLYSEGSIGQRLSRGRETFGPQGRIQVGGDAGEDVGLRPREPREYGEPGEGAEVAGVPGGPCGGRAERYVGVPPLEAVGVHRHPRPDVPHEIVLGSSDGPLPRFSGQRLGVRTGGSEATGRDGVPTGFRRRQVPDHRGEGLPDGGGRQEGCGGGGDGVSSDHVRREGTAAAGNPHVVNVRRIPGVVEVFDIETESQNFFQNGILVHNCYVNSGFRGYRGTGLITVPLDYGPQIGKQLRGVRRAAAGYFSSFTDPFTPLEAYYHNTENAAAEFVKVGLPVFFLSRLRYPEWAVRMLTLNPHSYAQKSVNTSDPDDWKKLSPGGLGYREHLADIARLKRAGVYVSIQCNPIVPGVTTHGQIRKLFKDLAAAGADHVIVKFVEAGYSWAPAMAERMVRRFGARGEAFAAMFTQNIGSQRTVDQAYRLNAHDTYSRWAGEFGLTYSTCYEYEYETNPDGSIKSKTGVSVARRYTTSAQCHGHAVSVYTRDSDREPFRPVEECPPTGCLYCADDNGGEPRCGDELAGAAVAVKMPDLRQPIGKGRPPQYLQLGVRRD